MRSRSTNTPALPLPLLLLLLLPAVGGTGCGHQATAARGEEAPATQPRAKQRGEESSFLRNARRTMQQLGDDLKSLGQRVSGGARQAVIEAERELAGARRDLDRVSRQNAKEAGEAWQQARRAAEDAVRGAEGVLERARQELAGNPNKKLPQPRK